MQSEWWTTFFTGPYLEVYKHAHTEETTRAEVDRLEPVLHLPPGGRLLDVPCGSGRHAIEFARRGYAVDGIDLSAPLLDQADQQADAAAQLNIAWHCQDMRKLSWKETFDGAICLWGSFGYFDDEGNRAFVEAVAQALKPGARFVLETPTVEAVFQHYHLREHRWVRRGELLLLEEWHYEFQRSCLERRWTYVHPDAVIQQHQMFMRLYTYRELCQLLDAAGFEQFEGYDANTMQTFTVGSPLLLLAMTKG